MSLEWKRVGVMDNDSGDDGTADEVREYISDFSCSPVLVIFHHYYFFSVSGLVP